MQWFRSAFHFQGKGNDERVHSLPAAGDDVPPPKCTKCDSDANNGYISRQYIVQGAWAELYISCSYSLIAPPPPLPPQPLHKIISTLAITQWTRLLWQHSMRAAFGGENIYKGILSLPPAHFLTATDPFHVTCSYKRVCYVTCYISTKCECVQLLIPCKRHASRETARE